MDLSKITDIKELKAIMADEFLRQIELNNALQQSGKNVDLLLARKSELEAREVTETGDDDGESIK
jgi:hypothetical protein